MQVEELNDILDKVQKIFADINGAVFKIIDQTS